MLSLVLSWATCTAAVTLQAGAAINRALSSTRPVVVHVWDPEPTKVASIDVEELSSVCRDAGAAAILVPPALVGAVADEQASSAGSFPGPLPVIADCELESLTVVSEPVADVGPSTDLAAFKSLGAAGVAIRRDSCHSRMRSEGLA